jgi:hypothetical protein
MRLGTSVGLRVDAVHLRRLDERGEDEVMQAENDYKREV